MNLGMNATMKDYMPEMNENIAREVTLEDLYAFDLNGFLVVEDAVDPEVLDEVNRVVDGIQAELGMTAEGMRNADGTVRRAYRIDNIIFRHPSFAALATSPKVLSKVANFITYPRLKSTWLDFKAQGGGIGYHSNHSPYTPVDAYHCHNFRIHCNLLTVCYALCDIPLEGGALEVIPGSHKANFPMPGDDALQKHRVRVPLKKGSALLFSHDVNHGSLNELPYVRRAVFTSFSTGFSANTLGGDDLYDPLFEAAPENSWEKYFFRRPKGDRDTYPQPKHLISEEPGLGKLKRG